MTSATSSGEKERKIYVLDTNVVLYDPEAMIAFEEHDVVVPILVVDEIDNKKKDPRIGWNAREAIRRIDHFRASGERISDGIVLPGGGTFRVEINNDKNLSDSAIGRLDLSKNDNRILLVAHNLMQKEKEKNPDNPRRVVMVSNDGAVRIKADAVGIPTEEYRNGMVNFDTLYTGLGSERLVLPEDCIKELSALKVAKYEIEEALPNQFFEVCTETGNTIIVSYFEGKIYAVNKVGRSFGLTSRNPGQACVVDMLMKDQVSMATLVGPAGTGKTLFAVAAGLDLVNKGHFQRLVVTRSTKPVGEELGYLPGDIESKMEPWLRPVFDIVDLLMMSNKARSGPLYYGGEEFPLKRMLEDRILEIQPLAYARGITLPNMLLIIDDAQNLTPHEIKTLATRIGEGSKIILTGDPHQIDNPYINKNTNGLTHFVDHLKGQPDYGHVTLTQGERSRVATICSQLL